MDVVGHGVVIEGVLYAVLQQLIKVLENKIIPTYYDNPEKWGEIVFNGIDDVIPQFTSERMAREYYELLYR